MRKKINRGMLQILFISVTLLFILLSIVFYNTLANQVKSSLWENAGIVKTALSNSDDKIAKLIEIVKKDSNKVIETRYILIDYMGTVIFDNKEGTALAEQYDIGEEFHYAREFGWGESKGYSHTFLEESYYVAYNIDNDFILILSKTNSSIFGIFSKSLVSAVAVIFIVSFICRMFSKRITKSIARPINNVDLNDDEIVLYDEISVFSRNISKYKKQTTEHIAEIENKSKVINSIIENIKEGIVLINNNGIVITINKSAFHLLDSNENIVGKNILELTRDSIILEKAKMALKGESCETIHHTKGKIYQVFFSPSTINEQEQPDTEDDKSHMAEMGVIILFLDISHRFDAEKMRREFTANVTHELKTPLTSISGYAEMLANKMVKLEDYALFSHKINQETSRLILLIDDILLLSQLDENYINAQKEDVDIGSIAKKVMESLSEKANKKNVSLNLSGQASVTANQNLIHELIYNLIDNGIKYNKEKGTVEISLKNIENKAIIEVKDTGIGIPKKHLDRIFERFYRVDSSRAKKTGGTGLGLSIVKHIVMVYGGSIDMNTEIDVGTSIVIEIPKL